ncbi:hypothetical protein K7X08_025257 [Anisodus acutangulus]|uniref:Uncharacterized protein n=1 Tax=Anisodus acutangulus TaxID=402998 RepID=A0A9Q1MCG0_9SOLA|nr:hypothetical protein K7X08_025257 [Anisodus acutangulus]
MGKREWSVVLCCCGSPEMVSPARADSDGGWRSGRVKDVRIEGAVVLDIEVDDMEYLVRICKVCKCQSLQKVLEKELIHQKYAEYKALRDVDNSQKWFILQGISLPEENHLPNALHKILQIALVNSNREQNLNLDVDGLICLTEEMFDAASRYLLFPLKRAVADALLPHLEMVSPAELCHWYGVFKILEYCLDAMACNFETFADTQEFRVMLLTLTPPSGDSSLCTTAPSAPGAEMNTAEGNVLDGLREKWLEAEAAELDERDESALLFDKHLEMLMHVTEQERANGLECNASNEQELL